MKAGLLSYEEPRRKQEGNNECICREDAFRWDAAPSLRGNRAGSHLCFLTFTIKCYSCFQIPQSARDNEALRGPIGLKLYHLSNLLLFHPCQDNLLWVSVERLGLCRRPPTPPPPRETCDPASALDRLFIKCPRVLSS